LHQFLSEYATSQSQVRQQVTAAPIAVQQNIQNNVQGQHQQYQVPIMSKSNFTVSQSKVLFGMVNYIFCRSIGSQIIESPFYCKKYCSYDYRFPSLFAVDMYHHFGPRILNSQIKSLFLTGNCHLGAFF